MTRIHLHWACCAVLLLMSVMVHAQTTETETLETGVTAGLYALLSVTPDTPETRSTFEYADFAAARAALSMTSSAAAQDEIAVLRALPGFSPFSRVGAENFAAFPEVNGFAFEDINRGAYFGLPPEDAAIFQGTFNAASINAALTARGFMAASLYGFDGWCSAEGCDQGMRNDFRGRVDGEAFDNGLGRKPPILFSGSDLFFARDLPTLEAVAGAHSGTVETLGGAADVRAMLEAVQMATPAEAVIRAALAFDPLALSETETGGTRIPRPTAVLILDWVDESGQTAAVVLGYDDAESAQHAGEQVIANIGALNSDMQSDHSYQELFERAGGTTGAPVIASGDGAAAVIIPISYGMPEAGDNPFGLYYLLMNMVAQRDLAWLGAE